MKHRMSIRIPTHEAATVKPRIGRAVAGELRDVSFDGAFFVPTDKAPETLLERHVRVRLDGISGFAQGPLEIAARVVRVRGDGVGLEFDGYDEAVNDYLDRVYAERLTRESEPASLWR